MQYVTRLHPETIAAIRIQADALNVSECEVVEEALSKLPALKSRGNRKAVT